MQLRILPIHSYRPNPATGALRRVNTSVQFEMSDLLERAGCRIHPRGRADCAKCEGRSRRTIAFTDETFFCHRDVCGWKGNLRTLARELGLLSNDPEARRKFEVEERERKRRDEVLAGFEKWRNEQIERLTSAHRDLFRDSGIARRLLMEKPEDEIAWQALSDYHENESRLLRGLDFLMCAKVSDWLERDSRIQDVFTVWQRRQQRAA
jgi:hypothetical protein